MELGGNLSERPVTIGNVEGRAFTGLHGNGSLVADGNPDATAWPDPGTAIGSGFRGGSSVDNSSAVQVSDRDNSVFTGNLRYHFRGGRGARLAP